jgi:hypothetical protein
MPGGRGGPAARAREQAMQKQSHQAIDKTAENKYWQNQFRNESYYEAGRAYEDYEPAYLTGIEGFDRYRDAAPTFEAAEPSLRSDYERLGESARLGWDHARNAIRAAWHRLEDALPGDADRDRH